MKIGSNRVPLVLAWLTLTVFFAPVAAAFVQKLHSEEIQEAFSIGRSTDPDTVKQFFEKYSRMLDCPPKGACVNSIELRTPFEETALRSHQNNPSYTEQDAEVEYRAHPAVVSVHIFVLYPLDFSSGDGSDSGTEPQPDGQGGYSFYGFRIRLSQENTIKPMSVRERSIALGDSSSVYGGEEEIIVDFDPSTLRSEPARIKLITPDGQVVATEFDLRDLK